MSTDDSERLELDGLGEVAGGADSGAGRAHTTDLDRGHDDRNGWAARYEHPDDAPWMWRHRVGVGAATAVVAAATCVGVVAAVSRPPALDPVVRATIVEIATDTGLRGLAVGTTVVGVAALPSGVFRAAYRVVPSSPGDVVEILGLVGPGVRASTVSQPSRSVGAEAAGVDVNAVVDCHDSATVTSDPGDFWLRVSRTDAYGRQVVGLLPTPDSQAGWAATVASTCLQQRATTDLVTTGLTATAVATSRTVRLELMLRNDFGLPVTALVQSLDVTDTVQPIPRRWVIDAATSMRWQVDLTVGDCTDPATPLLPLPARAPGSRPVLVPGIAMSLTIGDRARLFAGSRWDDDQRRIVDAALALVCAGAPRTTVTLTAAAVSTDATTIGTSDALVRTSFSVATSGSTVLAGVSSPHHGDVVGSSTTTRFEEVGVPVTRGSAAITTTLHIFCPIGYVLPPTLNLRISTAHGTYPVRARVTDHLLAEAVRRACPDLTPESMGADGWSAR